MSFTVKFLLIILNLNFKSTIYANIIEVENEYYR
ncbi:hypothetical protein Clopa_2428 [Clostridium pasteurianum BC1]|uniref:Uncharacterized protein n=1 Tax=Clostridium pasteurianum BC1 TaxID=86416 RepID=R4K6F7_CLOPA|nr:hypothetical protein Clopa_2428 [Clostridium pasteurianum BC1]